MDFGTIIKTYGAIGAGGLALVVLIWLIIYIITKQSPILEQIRVDNEAHKEVIRNNTEAIKEMSRSNQNVAQALSLLDNSFATFSRLMDKHDTRAENIENEIIKIRESTKHYNKE
jgi:hypothetical protein